MNEGLVVPIFEWPVAELRGLGCSERVENVTQARRCYWRAGGVQWSLAGPRRSPSTLNNTWPLESNKTARLERYCRVG